MYGGENLAKKGVVFVNFNYRVGALGFLSHPELTAELPHHASGDYGFLDQIAALQWIKRNIAVFGGDPDNVTISGQSAGAASVSALEASPLAKGLFEHAFAMSLSFFDDRLALPKLADAEKAGSSFRKRSGPPRSRTCAPSRPTRFWRCRRTVSWGAPGTIKISPAIDGYFLPDAVPAVFAAGRQNDVPTVVGFTRDESSNELRTAANLDAYVAAAHKLYGDRAGKFLELYPAHDDADAKRMGSVAAREALVETGTRKWALAQRATGKAPFYMYMFSRVHPFVEDPKLFDHPQTIGAYHTSDVPYWFQTQDALNSLPDHSRLGAAGPGPCRQNVGLSGGVCEDRRPLHRGRRVARVDGKIGEVRGVRRRHRRSRGKRGANELPERGGSHLHVAARVARLGSMWRPGRFSAGLEACRRAR